MLKIFISNSILSDIIFQAEDDSKKTHDAVYQLLKSHQTVIYVSDQYSTLPIEVELFCQSYGKIPQENRCDFFTKIISNPSTVLEEPTSVFLLDIESERAKEIQEKYGVICLSKENAHNAGAMLIDDNKEYSPDAKQVFYEGWTTVLSGIKYLPSNSLIINDRYLFSNKESWKGNGISNVCQILQLLLPTKFAKRETGLSYNVLIVFDPGELCEGHTFRSIALELISRITSMRKYTIKLEILGISKGMRMDSIYFRLHNRRIISNYYIIKAEQQISAFHGVKGTCAQTITPQRFFTVDSLVKDTNSSSPQRSIQQLVEVLEDFDPNNVIDSDGFKAYYYLSATGKDNVKEECRNLANRLVRKKKTKSDKKL